ncbi:MAG: PA0069 family radical SAM protein [Planctomycetota bacterium]|nr:PA0069 family radical SAM protein [Planctomycetota bacterium]
MASQIHKGRGAVSSPKGRFEQRVIKADPAGDAPPAAPATVLRAMPARKIISHNQSPDIPFDRSINPYLGCEHGCVYCYARPSHSYLDLSPGLDFETRIFYKPNAVAALLSEWEKPGYTVKPVTIGANTDPYQPAEKKLQITRQLLETFLVHRHPVSLISKGGLMSRDLDLLAELASRNLVSVAISVPTINPDLKRILEPRVPAAEVRFRLIRELADAGVPVSLLLAPVIPALNDMEIEAIVERAAAAGISHASWILLRLPHDLKQIFTDWLQAHLPDRAEHVMSLVRQASGGRDYDNRYGVRQRGRGPYAEMLASRFNAICKRLDLSAGSRPDHLDCNQFLPPGQQQMALGFD